jgi:hypothetical protein
MYALANLGHLATKLVAEELDRRFLAQPAAHVLRAQGGLSVDRQCLGDTGLEGVHTHSYPPRRHSRRRHLIQP